MIVKTVSFGIANYCVVSPKLIPGGSRGVDGFRMGCQTVAGVSVTMHTVSSSPSGIRLKRT